MYEAIYDTLLSNVAQSVTESCQHRPRQLIDLVRREGDPQHKRIFELEHLRTNEHIQPIATPVRELTTEGTLRVVELEIAVWVHDAETSIHYADLPCVCVCEPLLLTAVVQYRLHLAEYFRCHRETLLETYRQHSIHGGD